MRDLKIKIYIMNRVREIDKFIAIHLLHKQILFLPLSLSFSMAATCAKWEGGVEGGRLHPAHRVAQVIIIAVK